MEEDEKTNIYRVELFYETETEEILKNEVKILKDKISRGFDINKQDENGDTELHMYVKDNFYPTVKAYCEAGADVNVRDKEGNSPLQTIMKNSRHDKAIPGMDGWSNEIFKILLKYGAVE
jgi:ankyrin repeat protein